MKPTIIVAICVICAATLMSGCVDPGCEYESDYTPTPEVKYVYVTPTPAPTSATTTTYNGENGQNIRVGAYHIVKCGYGCNIDCGDSCIVQCGDGCNIAHGERCSISHGYGCNVWLAYPD